ncbi:aldose 1-epimerase-like, partial [Notothenia coriiceps]|uniref:Aldose 1-epimerase-like n=1 Tax=Notothenia coriiceps TaxID=8208 RepID=A0A6I9PWA5_9TELE
MRLLPLLEQEKKKKEKPDANKSGPKSLHDRGDFIKRGQPTMTDVSVQQWGEVVGRGPVDMWVLQSAQVRVEVLNLGGILRSVCCRGREGHMEDVVLGFDHLEGKGNLPEAESTEAPAPRG